MEQRGYTILERGFRCRQGEIDLIARDGGVLVFVEVKYRRNESLGAPAEAVNTRKQRRIREAARYYLYSRGLGENIPCRFDVVGILGWQVEIITDAF